jgi:hypothetical protein
MDDLPLTPETRAAVLLTDLARMLGTDTAGGKG